MTSAATRDLNWTPDQVRDDKCRYSGFKLDPGSSPGWQVLLLGI